MAERKEVLPYFNKIIRPGDWVRVIRGSGPSHSGRPLGPHGLFEVRGVTKSRTRWFLTLVKIEDDGSFGTTHELRVLGPVFPSKNFPGMTDRPYRIRLVKKGTKDGSPKLVRKTSKRRGS